MNEELNFAKDLAIILISAGIFTIICKALKQPSILGYIIAGFLISPNLGLFGNFSSETVHQWSDIGIIFLMFGLGLEFSFKKLLKAGTQALVTAFSKFVGVFVIGFTVGLAMSWSTMESIFLAGLLSMSSTVVVIKSYDEMGLKNKPWAPAVFGTLVVEDLIAILLMVLLSTLAISNKFSGGEMLLNLAKLAFFLILWFLVGIYVIPTVLKKTGEYLNNEILLIVSLGLCFGMVTLATKSGFSSALGAFMMGSILAETIENERILKLVGPIKDLFAAVFFVSVGMMISPIVIAQHWWVILLLAIVVVITHIVFVSMGVILSGGSLRSGVNAGFSLAQLGEFGFIIASVGVSLGVMREFIYPVIIAVSVITIFITPYMIKLAAPTYEFLHRKLPDSLLSRIDHPDGKIRRSDTERSLWKELLRGYFLRVILYGVILVALVTVSDKGLTPLVDKLLPSVNPSVRSILDIAITLLVMSPFIYGLSGGSNSLNKTARGLLEQKRSNVWALFGLILIRIFISLGFILVVIARHARLEGWVAVVILFAGVIFMLIARHYFNRFDNIERQFLSNLNEREENEKRLTPVSSTVKGSLGDYDVRIEPLSVSPDSNYAGYKLKDIPIRAQSGANIIKISRGSKNIVIPTGNTPVYPYDKLLAVGTADQIEKLRKMMEASSLSSAAVVPDKAFKVVPTVLDEMSFLTGKALREVNLRDSGCMVISVLHLNEFITNPHPDFVFSPGDKVWVAGDVSNLSWIG